MIPFSKLTHGEPGEVADLLDEGLVCRTEFDMVSALRSGLINALRRIDKLEHLLLQPVSGIKFEVIKGREVNVEETIADIAYQAGCSGWYSGNSRDDMRSFIYWAHEFEKNFVMVGDCPQYYRVKPGVGEPTDYMDAIEDFCKAQMDEEPEHYGGEGAQS